MAHIDLHTILMANASLAREKKELVRLLRMLTETVNSMAIATSIHGETTMINATEYRSIPKGFLVSLMRNRLAIENMKEKTMIRTKEINDALDEVVGDDEMFAKAYYESLIDELNQHGKKSKGSGADWFQGHIGADGMWYFNSKLNDPKTNDFYQKHKDNIDKLINDNINQMFPPKIDPNNFGGDLEGEWQDGLPSDPNDDGG